APLAKELSVGLRIGKQNQSSVRPYGLPPPFLRRQKNSANPKLTNETQKGGSMRTVLSAFIIRTDE
ncbi:MAG: hypothetical protein IK955_10405, partial [Clostridia bacterium]|nr:hypothetical protein [Clostridia bacterium]